MSSLEKTALSLRHKIVDRSKDAIQEAQIHRQVHRPQEMQTKVQLTHRFIMKIKF
ncbi:hypothetical protein PI124_g6065 [Phytophthora idaei]|nr:hypothetical protein PI125_g7113 [Phytophthora idaei]KAG3156823.1 hypothetical protein PI126_g8606 [Phytophthora idaei]KAG3249285.1 hypothetical protein PI124_g6065 [Phytophthora idaei]